VRQLRKGKGLVIPKAKKAERSKESKFVHTYKNGTEHNLHSLSLASDGENFLSADETSVSLWNLDRSYAQTSFILFK
jgi:hypothetical protein